MDLCRFFVATRVSFAQPILFLWKQPSDHFGKTNQLTSPNFRWSLGGSANKKTRGSCVPPGLPWWPLNLRRPTGAPGWLLPCHPGNRIAFLFNNLISLITDITTRTDNNNNNNKHRHHLVPAFSSSEVKKPSPLASSASKVCRKTCARIRGLPYHLAACAPKSYERDANLIINSHSSIHPA